MKGAEERRRTSPSYRQTLPPRSRGTGFGLEENAVAGCAKSPQDANCSRNYASAGAAENPLFPLELTKMFQIVLVEPEIPPNTGNIGRLCLATGSVLHLIEPLGFSLEDKFLKRAGLDYWDQVTVRRWPDWDTFRAAQTSLPRFWFLTTKTDRPYWNVAFAEGDFLVFGRETRGLPEPLLAQNAEHCLTIPMVSATRSLNLATAVGIVLYEGVRQLRAGVR